MPESQSKSAREKHKLPFENTTSTRTRCASYRSSAPPPSSLFTMPKILENFLAGNRTEPSADRITSIIFHSPYPMCRERWRAGKELKDHGAVAGDQTPHCPLHPRGEKAKRCDKTKRHLERDLILFFNCLCKSGTGTHPS